MKKKPAVSEHEDTSKNDVLEVVFDDDETTDLTPPKHFHRVLKARNLSTGPLANPRRTRLI